MLPGWYGTGSAFEQWIDGDETKLATLRRYYEEWPFFTSVMSNMAQVMAKSDMGLAHRYAQLVPDEELRDKVFGMIVGGMNAPSTCISRSPALTTCSPTTPR